MLIAEHQRNQVRRQVQQSGQPVVIANASGRILQFNAAFNALLPRTARRPLAVADLAQLLIEPEEARRGLHALVAERRAWRGEVLMDCPGGEPMPLLVRADPVFTGQDRSLGFVLLFTDLTERKAAEAARRRFQEAVIQQRRPLSGLLDSKADLVFRNLLTAIVENAQLAALEIADGVDPSHMPDMLEAVRASVARTAEVLGYLVWHATSGEDDDSATRH
jgi:PAS domain-containing protein